jgi:hypothetical protein
MNESMNGVIFSKLKDATLIFLPRNLAACATELVRQSNASPRSMGCATQPITSMA